MENIEKNTLIAIFNILTMEKVFYETIEALEMQIEFSVFIPHFFFTWRLIEWREITYFQN